MGRFGSALLGGLLLVGAVAACADAPDEDGAGETSSAVSNLDPTVAGEVAITEPGVLRSLTANGFGFGHHFGLGDDARADALAASPAYKSMTAAIAANLATLSHGDTRLGVGMSHDHRAFDPAWLTSARSRFELVAVTNRLDRATRAASNCGEVRFIYRLAYDDPRPGASSRMPMTVAVVVPQKAREGEHGACAGVAARWLELSSKTGDDLVQAAEDGPLRSLPYATSFETNLQAVRWPSTQRRDMGGEAEYMLNVWTPGTGGKLVAAPLENTPDVAAIAANPDKKARLVAWIKAQAPAIDRAIVNLPDEFLARTAYSYGPRGLARQANRPFTTLVNDADLDDVSFEGTQVVKSAAGLLRRLDERSCQGCHQARAMAGFHVLGNEDDQGTNDRLNRLAVGTSPHFNEEIAWRSRLVKAVSRGGAASVPHEPRPFAEHANDDGLVGQSCGLGTDPTFAGWTCKSGLTCADMIGDGAVGVCVPARGPSAGDACQKDQMVYSANPHADTVQNLDPGTAACQRWNPAATCSDAAGGFPGGACAAPCTAMGAVTGEGICGTAPPDGFNSCMIAGEKGFEDCMSPPKLALRRACNVNLPCRDDYACAYVPGAPRGTGACMPPYFIFEARVDGHQ